MTTTEVVDFMKLLKAGDNKRTIEYVDKAIKEAYADGYMEGQIAGYECGCWPEYGGLHSSRDCRL